MSFSDIRRPEPGEAVTAALLQRIVAEGQALRARLDSLPPLPPHPRGVRGPRGLSCPAGAPMPRLSLLAPALITGGQLDRYRPSLALLGDNLLPPVGTSLSPWYAIWCAEPRMEGGSLAVTPPRNSGWVCTALAAEQNYALRFSALRDNVAPRDVWYYSLGDGRYLPTYSMHGVGVGLDLGLEVTLTEGEPSAGAVGVSGGFADIPLGVIRWSLGAPYYIPLLKTLSV